MENFEVAQQEAEKTTSLWYDKNHHMNAYALLVGGELVYKLALLELGFYANGRRVL